MYSGFVVWWEINCMIANQPVNWLTVKLVTSMRLCVIMKLSGAEALVHSVTAAVDWYWYHEQPEILNCIHNVTTHKFQVGVLQFGLYRVPNKCCINLESLKTVFFIHLMSTICKCLFPTESLKIVKTETPV